MQKDFILILLTMLLLFWSCQENVEVPQEFERELKVSDVQRIYELKQQERAFKTGRSVGNFPIAIDWENHDFKDIDLGEAISFGLESDSSYFITGTEGGKMFSVKGNSYAYAYQYEDSVHLLLVQPVPSTNSREFTGRIYIREWNGEIIKVFEYEEGVYVRTLRPADSNSSGRMDLECETTHYYSCTSATSPTGNTYYGDCDYEGSSTTCYNVDSESAGTPEPSPEEIVASPGGGGDGDSSDSDDENCPHPFDPNLTVPCNDTTCGPGSVSDGEGGCRPCDDDPLFNMEIADINSGKSSSRFGCVRVDPDYTCDGKDDKRPHHGIDLEADIGQNVYSISGGTVWDVRHTDNSRGYGNHIVIETNEGYVMYAHLLNKPDFNVGDSIEKGQFLGFSGESDTIGKPHLHLEMRDNSGSGFYSSTPVNIENYLNTEFDSNNNTIENENCN